MLDLLSDLTSAVPVLLAALGSAGAPFGMSASVSLLHTVWNHVQACKINKAQLTLLAHSACEATSSLVKARRLNVADQSVVEAFDRVLRRVERFIALQRSTHLLRSLLKAKETELQIGQLQDQLQRQVAAFGVRGSTACSSGSADASVARCRRISTPPASASGSRSARGRTSRRSRNS